MVGVASALRLTVFLPHGHQGATACDRRRCRARGETTKKKKTEILASRSKGLHDLLQTRQQLLLLLLLGTTLGMSFAQGERFIAKRVRSGRSPHVHVFRVFRSADGEFFPPRGMCTADVR